MRSASDTREISLEQYFFELTREQFVTLDKAVTCLASLDAQDGTLAEWKLFAGLTDEEIANLLNRDQQAVSTTWDLLRVWFCTNVCGSTTTATATISNSRELAADARLTQSDLEWTPSRWKRIRQLFPEAMKGNLAQRSSWIASHCGGDTQLQTQLNFLFSSYSRAAGFLVSDAVVAPGHPVSGHVSHSLDENTVISGRFKIMHFIDSGGMGEVYEAWDLELREKVALKTIRHEVASVPAAIERFKREVQQARGIAHPSVCRVYDLFSHGDDFTGRTWFLTMELLEGETLSSSIRRRGAIPVQEAFGLVEQMVRGLAAAHSFGIVHRDFKSSNVMLVPDASSGTTRAVITDFGLALNLSHCKPGTSFAGHEGTPEYMAPEQKREGPVGFAADQYALGVVMCEMLTGKRPHPQPPRPSGSNLTLPPKDHAIPSRWERVIQRCMQPRPEDRYASVTDVISALSGRTQRNRMAWTATAAVLVAVAALFLFWPHPPRLEPVAQLTSDTDFSSEASLSRDGRTVAYSSDRAEPENVDIWVQHLPSGNPLRITSGPADDRTPNISPDGKMIAWRSSKDGGGIYLADIDGANRRLLVSRGKDPAFSPDGKYISFWTGDDDVTVASGQLYLIAVDGGQPLRLASDFADARMPGWSSNGRNILFTGCRNVAKPMPACAEWWVTSVDGKTVTDTGALSLLRAHGIVALDPIASWDNDHVMFSGRGGNTSSFAGNRSLWSLRLSSADLHATDGLQQMPGSAGVDGATPVAENGTIAFSRLAAAVHIWRIARASVPSGSTVEKVTQDPGDRCPYISRNGRWLVFTRGYTSHNDVWIRDSESGKESILTGSGHNASSPIIDDSGTRVVFESRNRDTPSIYLADGQSARPLCQACSKPSGWFGDARAFFYREGTPSKIKMMDLDTGNVRTVLESADTSLSEANWSPQSQYLLFKATSGRGGGKIYAVAFPASTERAGANWVPVTSGSEEAAQAKWSDDGKTILYLSRRDGYLCIWGQAFDAHTGWIVGEPFPVMHYHSARLTPDAIIDDYRSLSAAGDSVYLDVGELRDTVWIGSLKRGRLFARP